jgi:DNA repair photolyase
MALNKSKGNMYEFVTHTWNTVKGACPHDCSYCYMKKWGKQPELHFDEKELKTDLGFGNFIFVGSSCDMFADDIPEDWIADTLIHCGKFDKNKYLFQTKNPKRIFDFEIIFDALDFSICTTIETNRWYPDIMKNSPNPVFRASFMNEICHEFGWGLPNNKSYVTIEPVLDFDLKELSILIEGTLPYQVNIGADSCNNNLPEPSPEKIRELISELEKFTKVHQKKNLSRLLK